MSWQDQRTVATLGADRSMQRKTNLLDALSYVRRTSIKTNNMQLLNIQPRRESQIFLGESLIYMTHLLNE